MTVYNITKLIDTKTINAIKIRYNLKRVQVMYSDWLNEFGLRLLPKEQVHNDLKELLLKYIVDKFDLMNENIYKLTSYPKCNER